MSDCTLLFFFFLNNVPKTLLAQKHEWVNNKEFIQEM